VLLCQNPVCKRKNFVVDVCLPAGKLRIGIGFMKKIYGEGCGKGSSAPSQVWVRTGNDINVWCIIHDELGVGFWNGSQALDLSHVSFFQTLKHAFEFRPQDIQGWRVAQHRDVLVSYREA